MIIFTKLFSTFLEKMYNLYFGIYNIKKKMVTFQYDIKKKIILTCVEHKV